LREKQYDAKGKGCYMFRMDDDNVVDATCRGNITRFVNHCCEVLKKKKNRKKEQQKIK
jgi:SET domain-containing protein